MWNKEDINYTLYLVTNRILLGERNLYSSIEEAISGGITLLQLREKDISTLEFYQIAKQTKKITAQHHIPFIINDRLDIALAVNADGLHIGQDDLPMDIARTLLGPDKIIGVSVATIEEALLAQQQGADYLGVGSVFSTTTKSNVNLVSLDMLRQIKLSVNIPVVAIGGINESNVQKVMAAGIDGVSVISAILGKKDIKRAVENLSDLMCN